MMDERMKELVGAVRAHALENYNDDGWDFLVECWDDEEIAEEIGKAKTVEGAIRNCRKVTKMLGENRAEIMATVW